jgi:hypothetical protein
MIYLRIRKISIDVIPDSDPFVSINIEKIITDDSENILQVIGNFDRIYERASAIPIQLAGDVGADGVIDNLELFNFVAGAAYMWVISKHGGEMINGKLVIEP